MAANVEGPHADLNSAVAGIGCRRFSKSHVDAGIEESFATFAMRQMQKKKRAASN